MTSLTGSQHKKKIFLNVSRGWFFVFNKSRLDKNITEWKKIIIITTSDKKT